MQQQIINILNKSLEMDIYNTRDSFQSVMSGLANNWHKLEDDKKDEIANVMLKVNKNYLGDVKWVLYQYLCDMNANDKDVISIRCGTFAFNKLAFMPSVIGENIAGHDGFPANINGENILVFLVPELNKKQLIISTHDFTPSTIEMIDTTIYPDDIVLYFA